MYLNKLIKKILRILHIDSIFACKCYRAYGHTQYYKTGLNIWQNNFICKTDHIFVPGHSSIPTCLGQQNVLGNKPWWISLHNQQPLVRSITNPDWNKYFPQMLTYFQMLVAEDSLLLKNIDRHNVPARTDSNLGIKKRKSNYLCNGHWWRKL